MCSGYILAELFVFLLEKYYLIVKKKKYSNLLLDKSERIWMLTIFSNMYHYFGAWLVGMKHAKDCSAKNFDTYILIVYNLYMTILIYIFQ